jgi:hypothetical protein
MAASATSDPGDVGVGLLRAVLADDANLEAALRRVAAAAQSVVPAASDAAVALLQRTRFTAVGATSERADDLERAQHGAGSGPSIAAATTSEPVNLDVALLGGHRGAFIDAASAAGIGRVLALPLCPPSSGCVGSLTFYAESQAAFDSAGESAARAFAAEASITVANVGAYWAALAESRQLLEAMSSRAVIEQAKGVLMARSGCSPHEAFDMLRRASQRENRKLRVIAADIVAKATDGQEQ